ncbi:MAG TPA: hypothetical protein VJA21_18040 [Verrucomicrobiae bacterium]
MKFIWGIAGAVLAGLVLGYWVSKRVGADMPAATPVSRPPQDVTAKNPPEMASSSLLSENPVLRPNPRLNRLRRPVESADTIITNWEERVGEILASGDEDVLMAKDLLDLFPRLPLEGQVEVVRQLGELLPDEEYPALARHTTNTALPEPVLEALIDDLADRADQVRLPMLLTIAEDGNHPKNAEALELLEEFMDETFGTNWDQWSTNIDLRLNAQPQDQTGEMEPPPGE